MRDGEEEEVVGGGELWCSMSSSFSFLSVIKDICKFKFNCPHVIIASIFTTLQLTPHSHSHFHFYSLHCSQSYPFPCLDYGIYYRCITHIVIIQNLLRILSNLINNKIIYLFICLIIFYIDTLNLYFKSYNMSFF